MPRPISVSRRGSNAKQPIRYYVSTSGVDTNPGTFALPFATWQKAHDVAVAGDVVCFRGGTYQPTATIQLTRDGTAGKPIVYKSFPGELAIFDGVNIPGSNYNWLVRLNSASYNHIKNIEIKNGQEGGIILEGESSNNVFEMLDLHHHGVTGYDGRGLMIYGTGANNLILNCDSHHNEDMLGGGYGADGFQITSTGSGNVLRGCRAWNNSDDGFDLFNTMDGTTGAPVTIDQCLSWHNGYAQNGTTRMGDGNGFKLGGRRDAAAGSTFSGGHTVTRCVAWDNPYAGFSHNNASIGMFVYNNTSWSNGYSFEFPTTIHTLKNNLALGGVLEENTGDTFNSWNLAVTVTTGDFQSTTPGTTITARNSDGSINYSNFLKLAVGSDLIDKGTDVGLPYNGTAPDLGAFES